MSAIGDAIGDAIGGATGDAIGGGCAIGGYYLLCGRPYGIPLWKQLAQGDMCCHMFLHR